jgi:hypothetical protein
MQVIPTSATVVSPLAYIDHIQLQHPVDQPDGRSMALESGRYMETVGWLSKHPVLFRRLSRLRNIQVPN